MTLVTKVSADRSGMAAAHRCDQVDVVASGANYADVAGLLLGCLRFADAEGDFLLAALISHAHHRASAMASRIEADGAASDGASGMKLGNPT